MSREHPSLKHLKKHTQFVPLIKKYGPPTFDWDTTATKKKNVFQSLVRSIIYQQLSGKAAGTIHSRFLALFPKKIPTPERVLKTPHTKLRSVGLSEAKARYVHNAAQKFLDGTIQEKKFARMKSDEIIDHLIQIQGVGEWTAHMLLIFTLGRQDILPTGDLGIRKGFQAVYRLTTLPSVQEMEKLAENWREHASVASWYLWRVADEKTEPEKQKGLKKQG